MENQTTLRTKCLLRMMDSEEHVLQLLLQMTPNQRSILYDGLNHYCNTHGSQKFNYMKHRCLHCGFFKNGDIVNDIDSKMPNYRDMCARCRKYICYHCGYKTKRYGEHRDAHRIRRICFDCISEKERENNI